MKVIGIRFDNNNYMNLKINDEEITELYMLDSEGNKIDYTVTKVSKRKAKKSEEV